MNLYVLDQSFKTIDVIDTFESFIWTDRYKSAGDSEIYCFPSTNVMDNLIIDNYLYNSDSEHLMIIDKVETSTDITNGDRILIEASSLETILKRRIIWNQTTINGNLQNGIKKLLTDSIISPSVQSRRISNFIFETSSDTNITKLSIDAQYTGDNLYDVITEICDSYDIGFKVTLNSNNQFVFKLYKGLDRSYNQVLNPYVIFSPKFDNITNSTYIKTIENHKNVALIAGEEENNIRKTATIGSASGLSRRELFVDARDISSKKDDGSTIPSSTYNSLLIQRGNEKLSENKIFESFEAEVDASRIFIYGTHFNLGDTVQVENEYGLSGQSEITEIIWSYDKNGFKVYPTFVSKNGGNIQ